MNNFVIIILSAIVILTLIFILFAKYRQFRKIINAKEREIVKYMRKNNCLEKELGLNHDFSKMNKINQDKNLNIKH